MTDKRTAYVITSGSYSDCAIHAVFDDKTLADEYVRRANLLRSNCDIEEYELNDTLPKEPVLRTDYRFAINPDTMTPHAEPTQAFPVYTDPADRRIPQLTYQNEIWVIADDQPHAFKIACDWWAQEKAKVMDGAKFGPVHNFLRKIARGY